jgi:hypothetical protein
VRYANSQSAREIPALAASANVHRSSPSDNGLAVMSKNFTITSAPSHRAPEPPESCRIEHRFPLLLSLRSELFVSPDPVPSLEVVDRTARADVVKRIRPAWLHTVNLQVRAVLVNRWDGNPSARIVLQDAFGYSAHRTPGLGPHHCPNDDSRFRAVGASCDQEADTAPNDSFQ